MEVAMTKKRKLPKRIAGVKIPKSVRKGPIGDFFSSSGGQVVLAEVLLALAAFYAARRLDGNTTAEALRHPLDSLRAGRNWSRDTSERFTRALGAGAQAFRAAMQEPLEGDAEESEQAGVSASEDAEPAKKKRSSRGEATLRDTTTGPH
jgi:hypothetical protein